MKMMRITVNKSIKIILLVEVLILATKIISFEFFMNLQIAFLSSFFVIIGSAFAYKRMIISEVNNDNVDYKRDFLDELEDPHELYDDEPINEAPAEELNLKEIVKEERKKIKLLNFQDAKKGFKAGVSFYRLIPYLFLILAFIALKNNDLLNIAIYLPSLLLGIITAHLTAKDLVS